MNGKRKSFSGTFPENRGQRGNAMVYVLIIVALFGALSFVLARQTDTSESGIISQEQASIYASTIMQTSAQLKQSVEQMLWTGSTINLTSANAALDFTTPDQAGFDTDPVINKVFHPSGGGVVMPRLPDDAINEVVPTPGPRWYIGRVNNVEWTPSTANDVILTAYQINAQVCARINEKLAGSEDIPVLTVPAPEVLIYSSAANFTSVHCQDADAPAAPVIDVDCEGKPALCVEDSDGAYSFFSLLATE